ncbi:enoyl-CoA-hydratase DpgB [Streptomyces sp. NPDC088350]|uniref:enoyl-CoA-hydratase DpgB n=1 Tax=Streptomyces sp. NPDC088350 TaxID=3365854 RepID=UPI00381C7654
MQTLLGINGTEQIGAELTMRLEQACDRAEAPDGTGQLVVRVTGRPARAWTDGLTVSIVNRWERAVRRLERLAATTIAIADGACGGVALDVLLAADVRIATSGTSVHVPMHDGATWPGMTLFRLIRQGANAAPVRRAALFGEPIGAPDALALHLVDEVTEDADAALAAALAVPPLARTEVAVRRQLIADAATVPFEEALGVHLAACDRELRRLSAGAAR